MYIGSRTDSRFALRNVRSCGVTKSYDCKRTVFYTEVLVSRICVTADVQLTSPKPKPVKPLFCCTSDTFQVGEDYVIMKALCSSSSSGTGYL